MASPRFEPISDRLMTGADLGGVFLFALEGALVAVRADLDLFGILVLAFVTSVGGGIVRDLILGERPPAAFRDRRYPGLALLAVLGVAVAALATGGVARWTPPLALTILDAAALALAAVAGARKAMDHGLNSASVIGLGVLTGCGGGCIRDVLIAEVPRVLRSDFYASAAIAGALLLVVAVRRLGVAPVAAALATGIGIFALRVLAVLRAWALPHLY